ncbi:hypothetical protein SAMN05216564_11219 [Halopenitus persicus]|uniref:Uncharacterized protein n=2 Tax=Halopenitus persicus TaxID=1048396 RepID=A0A1H3NBB4_9EURY|nr:hypothetical protein SAMN05216564_11219 [Halopenitus persicus]
MMVQATSDTDDVTIKWEFDVTDSLLLQTLAYVSPSIFGGVAILAGGLLLWLVGSALLDGDLARAVGVVTFAALALLSRRYLPALLDTNVTDSLWNRYSWRGLAIGSVVGALVLLGSTQLHPMAPFAVFMASWVPVVLTAAFPTSGYADRAEGTLVIDDTEVPLEAVSAFRVVSIDTFVLCWLSYTRGVPTAPRIIVLPSSCLDVVSNLIETAPDASKREHSTIDRTERLIVGLFGLGLIAVGPLLWLIVPPGDGQVVALYAGAMFGLFGLILLWYAYSA